MLTELTHTHKIKRKATRSSSDFFSQPNKEDSPHKAP